MPHLVFYIGNEYPQVHDLISGRITIGDKDCDISLNGSSADFHAELVKGIKGFYRLENRGSLGSSTVNGQPVEDGKALKDGDQIRLGSVKAVFVDREKTGSDAESQGLKSLIRKTEVEQNNLRLLENDSKWMRSEIENSLEKKFELEEKVGQLLKEVETTSAVLQENREESARLARDIAEAKEFKKEFDELKIELNSRREACEEISAKVAGKEKRYAELDLENSIRQKEKLAGEMERLSADIETSRVELEGNMRASEEAASLIEEAQKARSEMGELEAEVQSRRAEREELENQIDGLKNTARDFETKITTCKHGIEKLTDSIKIKQKEIDDLSLTMAKNETLIQSAGERLTEVEGRIRKGLDQIAKSREAQKSLEGESATLDRIVSEKSVFLQRLNHRISSGGTTHPDCPPIRLVDPEMKSLVHYFHHGAGLPGEEKFDPVGLPAFAACTKGSMHRDADTIMSGGDPVLLLLSGDFARDKALIDSVIQGEQRTLLVCWEGGRLSEEECRNLSMLLAGVSGVISVDGGTAELLEHLAQGSPHLNVPIPCPVEFPDWDLSAPVADRTRGIFVNGDGFDPNSTIHRQRIELLNRLVADTGTTVTLYRQDPGPVEGITIPHEQIQRYESPLEYKDYLQLAGQHYLFAGFETTASRGRITGDAVLARTVFIGAEFANTVEQLLFPEASIANGNIDGALENVTRLLSDIDLYRETMERSWSLAIQLISFESVRDRLGEFIHSVSGS